MQASIRREEKRREKKKRIDNKRHRALIITQFYSILFYFDLFCSILLYFALSTVPSIKWNETSCYVCNVK